MQRVRRGRRPERSGRPSGPTAAARLRAALDLLEGNSAVQLTKLVSYQSVAAAAHALGMTVRWVPGMRVRLVPRNTASGILSR
jgi:hypothetical protein